MTPPIPPPRALPAPVSDRKAGGCLVSGRYVSAAALLFLFAITMASAAGTHRTDCISASQAGHTITLPEGFTITPCDDGTYRLEDSRSHGGTNCIYLGFGPKTDKTIRSGNLLWASTPHSQTREYTSTTPNPFIPGDSTRAALMHIRIVADNESIASYLKDIANRVVENARAFGGSGGGSGGGGIGSNPAFAGTPFTQTGNSGSGLGINSGGSSPFGSPTNPFTSGTFPSSSRSSSSSSSGSYSENSNGSLILTAVPEPRSLLLLLTTAASLPLLRRFKRK